MGPCDSVSGSASGSCAVGANAIPVVAAYSSSGAALGPFTLAQSASLLQQSPPAKRPPSEIDDSASACCRSEGGRPAAVEMSGKKKRGHDVAYYLEVLDLQDAVNGVKLGVSEHHARELLKKLPEGTEKTALVNRLADLEKVKKLSEEHIDHVPFGVVDNCLSSIIVKLGINASSSLEQWLVERKVKGFASISCT